MRILALTTATPRGGVAIVDGNVLAESSYDDEMMHAERIFGVIDDICKAAATTREQIDALACDVGPGSFTGVRVGVASAKGICIALGKPLHPVGSLQAMAAAGFAQLPASVTSVSAVLDAKRGEVFVATYRRDGEEAVAPVFLRHDDAQAHLAALIADQHRFVGRAGYQLFESIRDHVHRDDACDLPSASWIGRLAAAQDAAPPLVDIEPRYVREPDATPMTPR